MWGGTSHVRYCPFATGTSGDNFCKLTRQLDTWSDHVDEVSQSHLHAYLFSAYRYTTLAMASRSAVAALIERSKLLCSATSLHMPFLFQGFENIWQEGDG